MPLTQKLRRGIQLGLLVLVAVMPFHAFLSVWLGTLTGYQTFIQAWKEVLLLILTLMALVLLWRDPDTRRRLNSWPVRLIGLFAAIALLVTAFTQPPLTSVAFGAKTDLEFLVAFILAALVATPRLIRALTTTILASAAVVAGFGLLQAYVLPLDFLARFGYGPDTILPFHWVHPDFPDARVQATLGGPNQLGTYLMLPIALSAVVAIRRRQWWWLALTVAGLVVLFNTYSRAAYLGTMTAGLIIMLSAVTPKLRPLLFTMLALLGIAAALIARALLESRSHLKFLVTHGTQPGNSDEIHIKSLQEGTHLTLAEPLGHGLGTAGPAVFHTGSGLVIENYYLQLAYETGWAGALAFILLLAATARALASRIAQSDLALACLAALAGISIAALVLPAWADSSTALIFWTAAGSVIGLSREKHRV